MRRPSPWLGALLGGLTSLPLLALFFLGNQFAGLPFFPFDLFDWLARVLPGSVIRLGINAIVTLIERFNLGPTDSTAKLLEQIQALIFVVALCAGLGAGLALLLRRRRAAEGWRLGAGAGLGALIVSAAISASVGAGGDPTLGLLWMALLWLGWGALLGHWLGHAPLAAPAEEVQPGARRRALTQIAGGSLALALGAWGAGRLLEGQQRSAGAGQPLATLGEGAAEPLPEATPPSTVQERLEPAPGTRPELTANDDFYRIDINTRPVRLDKERWKLEVDGLFDSPRTFTLEELLAYPAVTQPVTMACISNRVGGDLIGTSNWTGLRLRDLLRDLGMKPEAKALYIEGADGFYETVVLEDLMDPRTLLVYGMNGDTLPVEHGFPLRVYIANRYGMKQPKWITRIEALPEWEEGYWVVRRWSREARPKIVSVIDSVARDEVVDGKVPVGGIAWAGDRGIQKVEVQVNEEEWVEAQLRQPPLSPLTWVQWRYDWPATPGRYVLRVRATDGTGELQEETQRGTFPDGATGYHKKDVAILQ